MLLVHHADHLFPLYLERGTGSNGGGRGQAQARHCREHTLSHRVADGEQRDGGFLAGVRDHCHFCPALLNIKDGIGRVTLRKKFCLGSNWTILRPSPALIRKAAASNAVFSSSTIGVASFRMRSRQTSVGRTRPRSFKG